MRNQLASPQRISTFSLSKAFNGAGVSSILWVVFFKIVLDLSYVLVRGQSVYYALPAPLPDPSKVLESYFLLIVVLAVAPKQWHRVSTLFLWTLLVISYVPMLTVYAIGDEDRLFMYATTTFWVAVSLGTRVPGSIRMPFIAPERATRLALSIYAGLCLISVVVLGVYLGGALIHNILTTKFNLSNFYDIRAEFLSARLPLHGYYLQWLALVFNPAFFVVSILKRKWTFAGLIFVWQLVISEAVGQRGFVFGVAFAATLAWMLTRRQPPRALSGGMASLIVGGVAAFYVLHQQDWYYFFTGRFLLDAGQLSFYYYHFFTEHGAIPFAYVIKFYLYLPYPGNYPYTEDPSYLVSEAAFHQHLAAVGGLVADAYMNLGFAGLALWAVGLIALGKLIDASAMGVNRAVAVAALAVPAVSLANTYTVRVIFTTGLGWSLILLFLLARSRLIPETQGPAGDMDSKPRSSS